MDCSEVCAHLVRYLDDDLPPKTRQAVDEHLEHCYLCIEELKGLSAFLLTCRNAMRFPNPRNRFDLLRPTLCRGLTKRGLRTPRMGRTRGRAAVRYAMAGISAAAVAVIFIGLLAPFLQTTWSLASFAERALDPQFSGTPEAKRIEDAAGLSKGPVLTLLARSCQILSDDPLSSRGAPEPVPYSIIGPGPAPEPLWKPLSMRHHDVRREFIACSERRRIQDSASVEA